MLAVMCSNGVTIGSGDVTIGSDDEGGKKRQGGRHKSKGSDHKQPCITHHEFRKAPQVIANHTDSKAIHGHCWLVS